MSNKLKFEKYCENCNYTATRPCEWLNHINTDKHNRDGKMKTTICNICNTTFKTHWIQKMHILRIHASQEERSKQKYYCIDCDLIFFSKLYLDKHTDGKIHQNLIKANNS